MLRLDTAPPAASIPVSPSGLRLSRMGQALALSAVVPAETTCLLTSPVALSNCVAKSIANVEESQNQPVDSSPKPPRFLIQNAFRR